LITGDLWTWWQVGCRSLKGLNTSLFVDRDSLLARFGGGDGITVKSANLGALLIKLFTFLRRDPIFSSMRLEVGLFLKIS